MRISKNDVDSFPRFCAVDVGMYAADSLCFFTGNDIDVLCKVLNSTYAAYYFFTNIAILDNGGMQMRQQYVENIPLPKSLATVSDPTNEDVFKAFGFTNEEVAFIDNFITNKKAEIATTNH